MASLGHNEFISHVEYAFSKLNTQMTKFALHIVHD